MIAIRPRADQVASPGERIAVEQPEPGDLIEIIDEVTLPERVHLVNAARRTSRSEVILTHAEAHWLYAVLGSILHQPIDGLPALALIARHDYVMTRIAENPLKDRPSEGELIVHRSLLLCRGEIERALAISNARATAESDRQEAAVIEAERLRQWIATVASESFGPFPVQTVDDDMAAIERGIFEACLSG